MQIPPDLPSYPEFDPHEVSPEPRPRWTLPSWTLPRWTLRGWLLASGSALLLLALLFAGALALSEDAPITTRYAARAALDAAREAGAATLAPEPLQVAEEAINAGTREMALQLNRFRWMRSFGRARALLETGRRRADLARSLAQATRKESLDEAHRLLDRADTGFREMD